MIKLDKLMPNGATYSNHRIQNGHIIVQEDNSIVYNIIVNSYLTEEIYGPISWQDSYPIQLQTVPNTVQELEQALVTEPAFLGGIVQ